MMLILRISSVLALTLTCVLLALAGVQACDPAPAVGTARGLPDAMAALAHSPAAHRSDDPTISPSSVPPLVDQAQALAAYLNGAVLDVPQPANDVQPMRIEEPPRPAAPPIRLMLYATSYYPDQPQRSMALVSNRNPGPDPRWVKEGARIGDFTIHEIRRGAVVYRQGDLWHEATVDLSDGLPSIVHALPGDSRRRRVGTAPQDPAAEGPAPQTSPQESSEAQSTATGSQADARYPVSFVFD